MTLQNGLGILNECSNIHIDERYQLATPDLEQVKLKHLETLISTLLTQSSENQLGSEALEKILLVSVDLFTRFIYLATEDKLI